MGRHVFRLFSYSLLSVLFWPVSTDPTKLIPSTGLDPGLSAAVPRAFRVPLEDVAKLDSQEFDTENLRQVLRIVDVHYVQRERLDPLKMLRSGISALNAEYGVFAELSTDDTLLSDLPQGDALGVWLCHGEKGLSRFCQKNAFLEAPKEKSKRKTVTLSARAAPFQNPEPSTPAASSTPANPSDLRPMIRVGNRVLYSHQSPRVGLRFVETLARPLIIEFSRKKNIPVQAAMKVFLNGVLDELDPHSSFLGLEEYTELRRGTRGQFGGVGVVIDEIHELPVVREIVFNSPAYVAGVQPGDVLLKVGKAHVAFLPLDSVIKEIRNVTSESMTPVWIYRPKTKKVVKVFLSRQEIPSKSVESKRVLNRPDILQIKVTGFSNHTAEDIYQTYMDSERENPGNIRYMILDLRGNPGGLLDQAIQVSDLFLHAGKIVSTRSRYDEQVEYATRTQKIDLPLVVLVNSSSASASEIVAGALKDHGRALIVGERTFGKGSVQSLFELGSGTALKLTMANYFTPSGKSIQSLGVQPHVLVKMLQFKDASLWMSGSSEQEREEDLAFHLENPQMASQLPDEVQYFGDGATQAVWSHTKNTLPTLREFDSINFAYPEYESNDLTTDTQYDSLARVGVSLADKILALRDNIVTDELTLASVLPDVQQSEARILKSEAEKLLPSQALTAILSAKLENPTAASMALVSEKFFGTENVVKMSLGPTVRAADGKLVLQKVAPAPVQAFKKIEPSKSLCCNASDYTFVLSSEAIPETTRLASGMVGMRLDEKWESSVVWVPATLTKNKDSSWLGRFHLPPTFRAYLSGMQVSPDASVSFFFKPKIKLAGMHIGKMHYDAKSGIEIPRGVQPTLSIKRFTSLSTLPGSSETAKITVKIPAEISNSQEQFSLLLVPLVDGRATVKSTVVNLHQSDISELSGDFALDLTETTNSSPQDFGGVVGAILRSSTGELIAKWPLVIIDDRSQINASTLGANENKQITLNMATSVGVK